PSLHAVLAHYISSPLFCGRPSPPLLFFSHPPATTQTYPLSLHDALPISSCSTAELATGDGHRGTGPVPGRRPTFTASFLAFPGTDRKSTRLNSSHGSISYAVFCLKKKKKKNHV